MICLLLFRYAMIPWMYLISRIFPSSDVAFISYISLNFIFGLCTMLMTAMPRLLAIISKAQVSHWHSPFPDRHSLENGGVCYILCYHGGKMTDSHYLKKGGFVLTHSLRGLSLLIQALTRVCRRRLFTSWSARTSLGTRYPLQSSAFSDFMLKITKSFKNSATI